MWPEQDGAELIESVWCTMIDVAQNGNGARPSVLNARTHLPFRFVDDVVELDVAVDHAV